jgi:ABC-type transport system substrate-binding protein
VTPRSITLTRCFALATAVVLLAACTPTPPPSSEPPATSSASGAAPATSVAPSAPAGGQDVVAVGEDDGAFNILLFPRSICACNSLIFSTLFQLNDAGNAVQGDLVDHWDTQRDGLGYTLYLRSSAVWHDGQPVTADDVVFSFDVLRDPKNADQTDDLSKRLQRICADIEHAGVLVQRHQHAKAGPHARGHSFHGCVEFHLGAVRPHR